MSDNDKLEQLWYTWSPIGLGVTTEYRVRAASRDLLDIRNERYKRMDPYLRYTLPQGVDPYGIPLEKAPTCLAFIDVGQERILIRKKYIGRDLVGRPGNFFSHLVAIPKPTAGDASDDIYSPPASNSPSPVFTAWDAISLWESDFWAKSDTLDANTLELQPTTHSELKSLSPYANAQPLSMMDSTKVEKYLPIVIQAFLTYGARMRLYMATQPEMVAALIWGLTRSMPQQLLTDLTFSTYETDYQRSPCQIVGTCWLSGKGDPQTTPQHFPPICYENGNLAINDYTGKCSVLDERTSEASFARFATQYWLGRGDPQYSPKGLLDKAEKPELNIGTPSDFLVLYKFYTAQSLTKEDFRTLLGNAALVAALLGQQNIQDVLIAQVMGDRPWWKQEGEETIASLAQKAEQPGRASLSTALSRLATSAIDKAREAIELRDIHSFGYLLALVAVSAPPTRDPNVWVYLLHKLSTPEIIRNLSASWKIRQWLLEYWGSMYGDIDAGLINSWLAVQWSELQQLLSSPLPGHWYTAAMIKLLDAAMASPVPLPRDAMMVVERQAQRFEALITQLTRTPSDRQHALSFFAKLVQSGYRRKMELMEIMLTAGPGDSQFIEEVLSAAQLSSNELVTLLPNYGPHLLSRPEIPPTLLAFIVDSLRTFSAENLYQPIAKQLFTLLLRYPNVLHHLPSDLSERTVRAWANIVLFVHQPTISPEHLNILADAILDLPKNAQPTVKEKILQLLTNCVQSKQDLLCILNRMTNVLADSWELLLERMVAIEQRRKSSLEIIALYIHRVLREAARRNFSEREPLIQRFLPVLLKDAPRETYYQIDRLAQGWEAEVAYEWNSYANKHRPPTIVEKAERAWDERQRRKALEDAKKALAGKKVMPIGKAYRPELKKEVTGEERASLILAYNFMLAWEADSDADLIKAFNDFSEYGQSESFELTDHEQKRIRLAQFRTVLKQKNRSALQLARDYGLLLRDYKGATPDEREWFELALRLLSAYEDENDRAIVAAVKAIIASGLGKFFKFTREEHERILSAQGQGQGKSSSKEQKPRGQIPPSVPTAPAQPPPRSGSLPNGQATAPSRPGSIPIPQGVIALVNGRPISKQMFIKVQKIKAPYLHNQIDLLEIQMENKPSLKSVNRPKVKELKEQAKPEKFQQLVLEDLVNDLLIQDGISQATTEGASQQEFEPQTHELTSDFDKLKKYIDATPHYQLFVDKQLEDSDLVEFLRLVWRQRLFAYYLKQKKRKEIEEWLNECKKKITIDYADEYNPKSGKRFPWFGKG